MPLTYRKSRKLIFGLQFFLLAHGFSGCEDCRHSEFDLEHPIHEWNLFPDYPVTVQFVNSSDVTATFIQNFVLSAYPSYPHRKMRKQGVCAETTEYSTYVPFSHKITSSFYCSNPNIEIYQSFSYQEDQALEGTIEFTFNSWYNTFSRSGNTIIQSGGATPELWTIHYLDSMNYMGTQFEDVIEFILPDSWSGDTSKFWCKENYGLIGFEWFGENWVRI